MIMAAEECQMDPEGLRMVEGLFWKHIHQGAHPGAVLAVYRYGQQVLDLYGGLADKQSGKKVKFDTINLAQVPRSC